MDMCRPDVKSQLYDGMVLAGLSKIGTDRIVFPSGHQSRAKEDDFDEAGSLNEAFKPLVLYDLNTKKVGAQV